jgi:hypothetical protein
MPVAEEQSKWVADLISGEAALPERERMLEAIEHDDRKMRKRYVASKRHTIQVDFLPYMRMIERERRQGKRRARGSGAQVAGAVASERPAGARTPAG